MRIIASDGKKYITHTLRPPTAVAPKVVARLRRNARVIADNHECAITLGYRRHPGAYFVVPSVPVFGHSALRDSLRRMRNGGTTPASLLLHGPPSVGKQRLALWFGQLLLCAVKDTAEPCGRCENCRFSLQLAHPDLHWFFPRPRLKDTNPSSDEIKQDLAAAVAARRDSALLYPPTSGADGIFVAAVRALVKEASLTPAMGRHKVFIVGEAERMVSQEGADQAANAFLKLLEEPPPHTTIILTSSEPGALLPTIRSRVVSIRVAKLGAEDLRAFLRDAEVARIAAAGVRALESDAIALGAFMRHGAPGLLLASDSAHDSLEKARMLLNAAASGKRSAMIKSAFALGTSGARGVFSDILDGLTEVVHARSRNAVADGDTAAAHASAAAIADVEGAKQMASGNVSPALIGIRLMRSLSRIPPQR